MTIADLRKCAADCNLSEAEAMNILQDMGVISDLPIWFKDVSETDIPKAVAFLYENRTH